MPSAKKPYKPRKRRVESGTAMFPNLHKDVENALSDEFISPPWSFSNTGGDAEANRMCDTNIMGRFQCRNNQCPSGGWGSKTIGILIRQFPNRGYNAVVFKQRCKTCNELGAMRIDENSYVERITYRLKKWSGIYMETPDYNGEDKGPAHEYNLCEGCKSGHCKRGKARDGNQYLSVLI